MDGVASGLNQHRVIAANPDSVCSGAVRYAPSKSLWFFGMLAGGLVGGVSTFTRGAFNLFLVSTAVVLLFGHSLGSHRRPVHGSFQCPKWLEYALVYLGVLVGLAGPIGLLRQHELRDYAQRLPTCHDYLRHGRSPWVDAWWQLNCQLILLRPPEIRLEPRIGEDRFYRFLERTWVTAPARTGTNNVKDDSMVSTAFNWYTRPIAEFLVGNFEEAALRFYARRAEAS